MYDLLQQVITNELARILSFILVTIPICIISVLSVSLFMMDSYIRKKFKSVKKPPPTFIRTGNVMRSHDLILLDEYGGIHTDCYYMEETGKGGKWIKRINATHDELEGVKGWYLEPEREVK
jgi:hypothetical protein